MINKFLSSLLVLAAFCGPTFADSGGLPKGSAAPKVKGASWIADGKDAKAPTKKEMAGKVQVLEFFAHW
ncbi:MAG: hypothetical protein P1V97_36115 [Planctomycetota bacterium]|nr:hypothetical protein [Planctomycetota bacterium]